MVSATEILIVSGVLSYAYSFLMGIFMGWIRRTEPVVPKYLTVTHVGSFMNGSMLLAMTVAINFSPLAESTELWAAWLLVVGVVLLALKDTLNWLLKVDDEFRETKRPIGLTLGGISSLALTIGLLIIIVGVFQGIS